MTLHLSIGEILEPAPRIPANEMGLLVATMNAEFALQPPEVQQPSYEALLAAKRARVAAGLQGRTAYLGEVASLQSNDKEDKRLIASFEL